MTPLEAEERARQIWGDILRVTFVQYRPPSAWAGYPTRTAEWEVVDRRTVRHQMDEHGHPLCHDYCAQKEMKL